MFNNNYSRILKGCVIKNKMQKSVVVSIERLIKHPKYNKFIKRTTKIYVHDEYNDCNCGDIIKISECRPISKNKSWKLISILKKK